MTAAEAAAQIASLSAAAQASYNAGTLTGPGITSLDQLKPGVNPATASDPGGMFTAPTGLTQLSATARGLQAGYYQLPGAKGAEYFDPSQGQASQEFVTWANSLTPDQLDPFTGQPLSGFIPAEGGPQAALQGRLDQSAGNIATVNEIIAGGKGSDGTYQASMDRALGTGPNQQFMLDANGKQVRVADALSAAPVAATYRDVSPYQSKFTFHTPTGENGDYQGYWMAPDGSRVTDYSKVAADTQAAVDANTAALQGAYNGLAAERVARGEDPNTGISAAETQSIYNTYQRIADPAEKAAYIRAQDPGNLTAGLRVARTAAKQGEQNWMTKNALTPTVTWQSAAPYGDKSGGAVKTTYGDVTQTDSATGRSIMFGNVAVKQEYVAGKDNGLNLSIGGHQYLTGGDVNRINGGVQMFMAAMVTGGILGFGSAALLGSGLTSGYLGAGGFLPNFRDISGRTQKGFGDWKSGAPQQFDPTAFAIGLGVGAAMQGIASFAGKYFSSGAATAVKAAPGFMSKYGMAGFMSASQLASAAKGRQTTQDMIQARQRTGG